MKAPGAALQREWAERLAASGFHDLEAGGEKLSNRGTPTRTGVISAGAYYEKAKAVDVSSLPALDRVIWTLHAARGTVRGIAAKLRRQMRGRAGGRYKRVRESILATRRALFGNQTRVGQGGQVGQCVRQKPVRLLKSLDLDTATLAELVAVLMSRPKRSSSTWCGS